MKRMKKIFAMLLALTMVLGMTMTASAETNLAPATITVKGMPADVDDAEVTYVQVIEPDTTNVTGWKFVNDDFAKAFTDAFKLAEGKKDKAIEILIAFRVLEGEDNKYVSASFINGSTVTIIDGNEKTDYTASQYSAALEKCAASAKTSADAPGEGSEDWTISASKAGLYVISAKATGYEYVPMGAYVGFAYDDGTTENATSLVGATVNVKGAKSEILKDIDNKGTEEGIESDKSVTEGDTVEFTAHVRYPYFAANNDKREFKITDIVENATFVKGSVTLVVKETETDKTGTSLEMDTHYKVNEYAESKNLEITIVDDANGVKMYEADFAGKIIEVKYSVLVGKGSADVVNKIKTTIDTTEDSVTLDKVQVVITKTDDKESQPLAGATFAIYEASETAAKDYTETKNASVYGSATATTLYLKDVTAKALNDGATAVSDKDGKVTFTGLDAEKTYYIKETIAPEGYSLNENYYKLTAGSETTETDSKTYQFNEFTGVTVTDTKLIALPSTGGIGTTIFTVAGCGIMIAAAFFFFASRKKEN